MKKSALSVIVAGGFRAGCADNLPKEITSHENYKNCQEVEKNLLTIQSSFEKDERTKFFSECNSVYGKELIAEDALKYKDALNTNKYKTINDMFHRLRVVISVEEMMKNRDNTKYFSK